MHSMSYFTVTDAFSDTDIGDTPCSVLGKQRKMDDEPRMCFGLGRKKTKHHIMAYLF